MNKFFSQSFTTEEVHRALFHIHPIKASGLDEGLSSLIQAAENKGDIQGFKFTRQTSAVSHLFFTYDTIIFFRADLEEARKVMAILNLYEEASGQKPNLDKTKISASRNTPEDLKKAISELMGVQSVEKYGKYLGLPTLIGISKKDIFGILVDRVNQKLKVGRRKLSQKRAKKF